MTRIFISGIPKGLKHGPVSRIIKQSIETVAQVKNISVHPNKGYAFVDLYSESSLDIVLTLNNKIEVNGVAPVLQRSKIGRKRHQTSNKQVQIQLNRQFKHQDLTYHCGTAGFQTYAEYQRDRPKREPMDVACLYKKRKQIKPWKKIKLQSSLPSPNIGVKTTGSCFERYKRRNYHYISSKCTSPETSAKHRNVNKKLHLGVNDGCTENDVTKNISVEGKTYLQNSTTTENSKTSPRALSETTRLQQRFQQSHDATNKTVGRFVKAYVYHSSKYLFEIDVDNKNVFGSVSAAICNKHTVPGDSLIFFYNGKLLNEQNQPTISDGSNIHITVKGVGGMNRTDCPKQMDRKPDYLLTERVESGAATNVASHPKSGTGECLDSCEQGEIEGELDDLETEMKRLEQALAKRHQRNIEQAELLEREYKQLTGENQTELKRLLSNTAEKTCNIIPEQAEGIADMNQECFLQPTGDQIKRAQVNKSDITVRGEVERKARVIGIRRSFELPRGAQPVDPPGGISQIQNYKNMSEDQLRIALIGKTGSGKSATCNTILGIDTFKSLPSARSVTDRCQSEQGSRLGKKIMIVDTPGMCDTTATKEDTLAEVRKLVNMTVPGPHAIILVVGIGRFTEEETQAVSDLSKLFGKAMYKFLIVVFTRLDDLEHDQQSLPKYVEGSPEALKKLLNKCNNRYIGFNNRASPDIREKQAKALIEMINKCNADNGGSHYSNDMYRKAMDEFRKTLKESQKQQKELVLKKEEDFRREMQENFRKKQEELEGEIRRLKREQQEAKDRAERTRNELIKLVTEKKRHSKLMEETERKDEEEYYDMKEMLEKVQAKLSKQTAESRSKNVEWVKILREHFQSFITSQNEKIEEEKKIKQNYEDKHQSAFQDEKEFELARLEQRALYDKFVQLAWKREEQLKKEAHERERQFQDELNRVKEQQEEEMKKELNKFRKEKEMENVKRKSACSIL